MSSLVRYDIEQLLAKDYKNYVENLKNQIDVLDNKYDTDTAELNAKLANEQLKSQGLKIQHDNMIELFNSVANNINPQIAFLVISTEIAYGYWGDYLDSRTYSHHKIVHSLEEAKEIKSAFEQEMQNRKPEREEVVSKFQYFTIIIPFIENQAINMDKFEDVLAIG